MENPIACGRVQEKGRCSRHHAQQAWPSRAVFGEGLGRKSWILASRTDRLVPPVALEGADAGPSSS
jgi:hypothetical protein